MEFEPKPFVLKVFFTFNHWLSVHFQMCACCSCCHSSVVSKSVGQDFCDGVWSEVALLQFATSCLFTGKVLLQNLLIFLKVLWLGMLSVKLFLLLGLIFFSLPPKSAVGFRIQLRGQDHQEHSIAGISQQVNAHKS